MESRANLAPPTKRLLLLSTPAIAAVAISLYEPLRTPIWASELVLFWTVIVITLLCAIGGVVIVATGWGQRLAEVTILGAAIVTLSLFPLVHGLTTPGILYGQNSITDFSAFIAVPAGLLVALPLMIGSRSTVSTSILRHWRTWSALTMTAVVAASLALLWFPNSLAAPAPESVWGVAGIVVSVGGTTWWAARHLRLYVIGNKTGSLISAAASIYLGMSTVIAVGAARFSAAFWGAHALDAIGVLGLCAGLFAAHRHHESLASVLRPVIERDPVSALELGLHPLVHRFVADLDEKDPVTRDHVVRVAELSMRVGERAGLGADPLRALGLAALMHDVGKLFTPDRILNKPGRLTDAEYEIIKDHTRWGAELMMSSPLLSPSAGFVRWHHERPDGTGYPDGLDANELPLEVTIISVCDSWDAMTFDRQYREALTAQQAADILRDGAGQQWTARAVRLLLEEIDRAGPIVTPRLDDVGRTDLDHDLADWDSEHFESDCGICEDALPLLNQ